MNMDRLDFEKGLRDLDIEATADPELLGSGFSSRTFSAGDHVIKISRLPFKSADHAERRAHAMTVEQNLIGQYVRIAPARFVISAAFDGRLHVVAVQEKVEGISIQEALRMGVGISALSEHFMCAQEMFREHEEVPDLACIERGFNPLSDGNTLLEIDTETPVLVDTTYGRLQRSQIFSGFIHRKIHAGVERAQQVLRQMQPTQKLFLPPSSGDFRDA